MATLSQFTFVPRMVSGTSNYPGSQIPNYTLFAPGQTQQGPAGGVNNGSYPFPYHDPSGLCGSGPYFEIVYNDLGGPANNTAGTVSVTNISANLNSYTTSGGAGKRIGFIAFDYVNNYWSAIFTVPVSLTNNGWMNDVGAIKDFCASLALLPTTNPVEFNDAYPPQASLPTIE